MENKRPRRDLLNELGLEESIVFENPDYDSAIIGYDANESRIIYDFEKMAEHLMDVDGMDYEEAVEFIEYNTIRAIPYAGSNAPIVLHSIEDYMDYHTPIKTEFNVKEFTENCITWIREWFNKNGNGCKAIIGMSGGKDSTVAAALCAKALGPENVIGVSMPDYNHSVNGADEICKHLGITYINMPIYGITQGFKNINHKINDNNFEWSKQSEQNIPPRIRMTMLYALAQTFNGRVVGTCNKSELYVGYATRYGDMASDFEPLGGITCRQVVEVGHYLEIPNKWVDKVPDDGLPNSEPDDDKFAKWGFSYKTLDEFLENGTCGDANTDTAIEKMHSKTKFKLNLGEIFKY
jgi:NAD+ synthase